jgi:transcriptional regulator with XRE-family HTH domain
MRQLSTETLQFAAARLARIYARRRVNQTELAELSGVAQSTISKILGDDDSYSPTEDALAKLFEGLGYNLYDIVSAPGSVPEKLFGYLATPLTALGESAHGGLRKVVGDVRAIAADRGFDSLPFDIYWPGDHTHPVEHANVPAHKVYLTDRSRASTHDFIILLCAEASYGVGQENEIATQAGIPAIRLVPAQSVSRMMLGSFVRAVNVRYEGTLESSITIPRNDFLQALQEIRKVCVRHRAFYHDLDGAIFGIRLKELIADRCGGDYTLFADDVGITLEYLRVLMGESLSVSNPGAILLGRIAARLCTNVGYLLGESEITDPIYLESNANWLKWAHSNSGADLSVGLQLRDNWCNDFQARMCARGEASIASFRSELKVMQVRDWDELYQKMAKGNGGKGSIQRNMFR